MQACCELVRELGGEIAGIAVMIELSGLNGRGRLKPNEVHSVIKYG
jgi:adenine phosphoribosyltransferase